MEIGPTSNLRPTHSPKKALALRDILLEIWLLASPFPILLPRVHLEVLVSFKGVTFEGLGGPPITVITFRDVRNGYKSKADVYITG